MTITLVANPLAGDGRVAVWQAAVRALEEAGMAVAVRLTQGPGDAALLVAQALAEGCDTVLAVGGDGTFHEAVQGFLDAQGEPRRPGARLGLIPAGTGNDFVRSLGGSDVSRILEALRTGRTRRIDVLAVRYRDSKGAPASRMGLNVLSLGAAAQASTRAHGLPRWLGGLRYLVGGLQTLAEVQPFRLRWALDGKPQPEAEVLMLVVGNGAYFGAGMRILPTARLEDGLAQVLTVNDAPLWTLVPMVPSLYVGAHLALPFVTHRSARHVLVETDAPLDIDGEPVGTGPIEVTVKPAALTLLA